MCSFLLSPWQPLPGVSQVQTQTEEKEHVCSWKFYHRRRRYVPTAQCGLPSVGWARAARMKGGEAEGTLVAGPFCLSSLRRPRLVVPFLPGLFELGYITHPLRASVSCVQWMHNSKIRADSTLSDHRQSPWVNCGRERSWLAARSSAGGKIVMRL